ncbi:MAG: PTS sugar transporter subunit IIA [Anaerolineaceae bacterium]
MMAHRTEIFSPASGKVFLLEEIPDEVFSNGLMGPGLAIELDGSDWNVYAPTDAQVSVVFPTGHAVVLQHQTGMEMLIHIGIDTFREQNAFKKYIAENQPVIRGQKLIGIDKAYFLEKKPLVIFTLINGKQFSFEKKFKELVFANKTILFTIY